MHTPTRRRPPVRTFVELEAPASPDGRGGADTPRGHAECLDERVDWDALEPRGGYADVVRPVLDELLLALVIVPALALGLPIAVANMIAFRSWRRVLFVQPRVGHRGRIFKLVKFRTMSEPAGSSFDSWSAGDGARVTRLGRFLRSSHLDELPQLLNVLRGEMSFIGPRPEMVEVEEWACANVPGFLERMAIKPGITGLAQVTQGYTPRDVEAYRRKLAVNRAYLRRYGLRTDLAILVRTAVWMARGRGWKWNRALPRG